MAKINADNDEFNPYAYLERGDFSSEKFKIEISNLPPHFGITQLRKKLVHLNLKPCKIKSVDLGNYAYVTFRSDQDKCHAMNILQGYLWKNRAIEVKLALANADPLILKRKLQNESSQTQGDIKKLKNRNFASELERLNDVVTPLWMTPYEDQLRLKSESVKQCLKKLTKEILKNNNDDSFWLADKKLKYDGLCCFLHPIQNSPITSEYRNKCEFSIGLNADGVDHTVGFRVGSYKDGDLAIMAVDDCINIPNVMKEVVKEISSYLKFRLELPSFNPVTRRGYWKHVTVRTSSNNLYVMVILVCHPQLLSIENMNKEKQTFKEFYETLIKNKSTKVTSLYFQFESDRKERHESGEVEHLLGEKFINESLLGMNFRISPLAFFQVNTPASELLYLNIMELCKVHCNTILLDLCCGTGTIGLSMAKKVKNVISIELNEQAIQDAKFNSQINGINNTDFICGKVENVLNSVLKNFEADTLEIVVVVDPPRAGLHTDVIRAIRKTKQIHRVVYVACKLPAAMNNIIELTRQISKRFTGKPFRLMEVMAVDLFPHTELFESVLLLERQPNL